MFDLWNILFYNKSMKLETMITESRNPRSQQIDAEQTIDILRIINTEDALVPLAVEKELDAISKVVDHVSKAFLEGGRLIYMGAGTSGRLGILDASECPPTYGTPHEMVVGLIAGGEQAIRRAVENAEDSKDFGKQDLIDLKLQSKDIVVGLAASGRTPYVIGGLEYAKSCGCMTAGISCNPNSPITATANIGISPIVGPEVITGSSRMKAGTAQKLVLNMITTASMIKIGKVYGNLMVDVEATNAKLVERQKRIVMEATGVTKDEAVDTLALSGGNCKLAIFIILSGLDPAKAKSVLDKHKGFIRKALKDIQVVK